MLLKGMWLSFLYVGYGMILIEYAVDDSYEYVNTERDY